MGNQTAKNDVKIVNDLNSTLFSAKPKILMTGINSCGKSTILYRLGGYKANKMIIEYEGMIEFERVQV